MENAVRALLDKPFVWGDIYPEIHMLISVSNCPSSLRYQADCFYAKSVAQNISRDYPAFRDVLEDMIYEPMRLTPTQEMEDYIRGQFMEEFVSNVNSMVNLADNGNRVRITQKRLGK